MEVVVGGVVEQAIYETSPRKESWSLGMSARRAAGDQTPESQSASSHSPRADTVPTDSKLSCVGATCPIRCPHPDKSRHERVQQRSRCARRCLAGHRQKRRRGWRQRQHSVGGGGGKRQDARAQTVLVFRLPPWPTAAFRLHAEIIAVAWPRFTRRKSTMFSGCTRSCSASSITQNASF